MSLTAEILISDLAKRLDKRRSSSRLFSWRGILVMLAVAFCLGVAAILWLGSNAPLTASGPEDSRGFRWAWLGQEDVPPEISKEGWPEVEILQPQDGDIVTGQVELRWRGDAPAGIGEIEIRVDNRRMFHFSEPTWQRTLDTSFLDEGTHRLEIRLVDTDRRRGFAHVDFTVRKPQFALLRVAHQDGAPVANGDEAVITVSTSGGEFEPRADFSALDSAFDATRVRWRESRRGDGVYEVRYRLSEANARPDGSYWVTITLQDPVAPQIRQNKQLVVELRNHLEAGTPRRRVGHQRPLDIPCAVYRPEAIPPSRGTPAPFVISGPEVAKLGAEVELTLDWLGEMDASQQRFLRVSVDGLYGYFALLGSCGSGDRITVKPQQVGDAPLRLAIWSDQGLPAVHTLRVEP